MNKAQLIDALTPGFDDNRKSAAAALDTVLETITRTVVTGEKVGITGFGVFEKLDKPARTVRNPATGASVKKKKTSVPRFRAGAELKAYVAGDKKFARVPAARKSATTAKRTAASTDAPAKTTSAKASATKTTAAKTTAAKTAATKSTGTKSTAAKTAPAKATATRTGAAKTGEAKSTAAKKTPKATKASGAGTSPAKKSATARRSSRTS